MVESQSRSLEWRYVQRHKGFQLRTNTWLGEKLSCVTTISHYVRQRPPQRFLPPFIPYFCPQSACSTIITINAAISDHHWYPVKVSIVYLCFTLSQLWTKILEIVLMVHDDLPNFDKQTSCQTPIKSNFCFEQFSYFVLPETAVCDIAQTFVCSSPIMHSNWPLSCDCDVKQRSDELTGFGWVF